MATSKQPSQVNSVVFPMRPSKAERYQIEREKDAQFAKIPQDLITEYFDLIDEKKSIEHKETMEIEIIRKATKYNLQKNLEKLEANKNKLTAISNLDLFDLISRLKRGVK